MNIRFPQERANSGIAGQILDFEEGLDTKRESGANLLTCPCLSSLNCQISRKNKFVTIWRRNNNNNNYYYYYYYTPTNALLLYLF
jgi:hypothetical protein